MPTNQPTNATVRPKEKSSVPLNNKREDQSIQRLALDLQNSLRVNCSINKTNTYQTSSSCNLNEQMLQRQFHSEKGTNRVTNETTPNPYFYEDSRHNPLHFDNISQNQLIEYTNLKRGNLKFANLLLLLKKLKKTFF